MWIYVHIRYTLYRAPKPQNSASAVRLKRRLPYTDRPRSWETYLHTYIRNLLTCIFTLCLLTCLVCLLACLLTYLLTCCLVTYLLLIAYYLTCLFAYRLTCLRTCLLPYLLAHKLSLCILTYKLLKQFGWSFMVRTRCWIDWNFPIAQAKERKMKRHEENTLWHQHGYSLGSKLRCPANAGSTQSWLIRLRKHKPSALSPLTSPQLKQQIESEEEQYVTAWSALEVTGNIASYFSCRTMEEQ